MPGSAEAAYAFERAPLTKRMRKRRTIVKERKEGGEKRPLLFFSLSLLLRDRKKMKRKKTMAVAASSRLQAFAAELHLPPPPLPCLEPDVHDVDAAQQKEARSVEAVCFH